MLYDKLLLSILNTIGKFRFEEYLWKTNLDMRSTFLLFLFSLCANISIAQIILQNSSFEDEPGDATMPMGWFACQEATTPDILPGYWGVYGEPSEGDTYVGIITRENGTFESIGQRLPSKLVKGECYQFSIDLAHSDNYTGYNKYIKLRIWVGDKKCQPDQMIFESKLIKSEDWENFKVEFNAESNSKYIFMEAYHEYDNFKHKGNILLDNLSPIILCSRA